MNSKLKLNKLFIYILLFPVLLSAQKFDRVISYQDFLNEISQFSGKVYKLENTAIRYDAKSDDYRFNLDLYDEEKDIPFENIEINADIQLSNVKFEERGAHPVFTRVIFKGAVSISNSSAEQLRFFRVKFEKGITVENLLFSPKGIDFEFCTFEGANSIQLNNWYLYLSGCTFIPGTWNDLEYKTPLTVTTIDQNNKLQIIDCHFKGFSSKDHIYLQSGNFFFLGIYNSYFSPTIRLNSTKVSNNFVFDEVYLENGIDMESFIFPEISSIISWSSLESSIGVRGTKYLDRESYFLYKGENLEQVSNNLKYNSLLGVYGRLKKLYQEQSNYEEYSGCYIALKDIQTVRLEYLYNENSSFQSYFAWQINIFMKAFSDYGTNPAKSVVLSFYVILVFGLIYFFFPNTWDTVNKDKIIKRIRQLIHYFRNDVGVADIFENERKDKFANYEDFKFYLLESKYEIPFYFRLLARPLYSLSTINYKLKYKFLQKTELLKGKWIELPKLRKASTTFIIGLWLTLYILFDLFVKILNALTLSINTFTTLGFGEIPLTGIPRYLAVLEGFIGWFMLTIFSVALIGQVLN